MQFIAQFIGVFEPLDTENHANPAENNNLIQFP